MKIKEGFVLRETAGSYVVMNLGSEISFNGVITLNETGSIIWKGIESGKDVNAIAEMIVDSFEIDLETAKNDTNAFIEKMRVAGVLE